MRAGTIFAAISLFSYLALLLGMSLEPDALKTPVMLGGSLSVLLALTLALLALQVVLVMLFARRRA
jgi:uncharacterized membrane protein (DUF485 family)